MIDRRMTIDGALGLGAYIASLTLISTVAIWCAVLIGGVAMSLIDRAIIDGSGQPGSDRETRRLATLAAPADALAKTDAAPAAAETTRVQIQPVSNRRGPTESNGDDPAAKFHNGDQDTYRTFCVRLCDGYFWPVSFSTTSDRFGRDQAACASSCNSPAKLFVHKMPGGNASTMSTLDGLPYVALKTAFSFRTNYDAQCKCQPEPWEQQAVDRHRLHAATDAARKGNRVAAATIRDLTAKVEADRQQDAKLLLIATDRANRDLAALAKTVPTKQIIAGTSSDKRRKGNGARSNQIAEIPSDGIMRLGAETGQPTTRSRWMPASGSGRPWKDKVFNGN